MKLNMIAHPSVGSKFERTDWTAPDFLGLDISVTFPDMTSEGVSVFERLSTFLTSDIVIFHVAYKFSFCSELYFTLCALEWRFFRMNLLDMFLQISNTLKLSLANIADNATEATLLFMVYKGLQINEFSGTVPAAHHNFPLFIGHLLRRDGDHPWDSCLLC